MEKFIELLNANKLDIMNIRNMESNYINNYTTVTKNYYLWDIYKHGDLFVYLDKLDTFNKLNKLYKSISDIVHSKFILMGPYVRSIFSSDKTNIVREVIAFIQDNQNQDIPSILTIDNVTVRIIKKNKNTDYIILKHKNWYERIAYDGTSVFGSMSFILEYKNTSKYLLKYDPILKKYNDPLHIYTNNYDIFDMIDNYDINSIQFNTAEIIKNNTFEIVKNNYTPIEYALEKYNNEDNSVFKSVLKNIIIILSAHVYKRYPYICASLRVDDINIKSKYNLVPSNELAAISTAEINKVIINYFIKHDRSEYIIDYLETYKYEFLEDDYNNIVSFNSRKVLESLIKNKLIDENNGFNCIMLVEALDLLKLLPYTENEILEKGKLLLDKIAKSDKLVSFYYLYKMDNTIANFIQECSTYRLINFITKLKPDILNYKNANQDIPLFIHMDKPLLILTTLTNIEALNTVNNDGNTILHLIVMKDRIDYFNYLLEQHKEIIIKNINKQNNDGETPLIIACKEGNSDFYYALSQFKPDMDLVDKHGNTAYHYICLNKICLGITIKNKANNYGFTPRDYCPSEYWKFVS